MSVPLCYYGSPEPLPPRRTLRAGPLTCVYEAGDLRYVKVGDVEVCRRLYAAVRDENWGTVPGVLSDEVIEETATGFRIGYTCTHQQGDVHFVWRADIAGTATGLMFQFDGVARSTFRRNRIGFCILHPPTCAGQPVRLMHPDLTNTDTAFPNLIAPDNPFREVSILSHALPGGGRAAWTFTGDAFETEDQRNWTDASFKTFCTPLSRPFPVTVEAGERVKQAVTLLASGVSSDRSPTRERGRGHPVDGTGFLTPQAPTLARASGCDPLRLPALGLGVGVDGGGIEPAFRRADIDLTQLGWVEGLRAAAVHHCPLEVAVTTSGDAAEIAALVSALKEVGPTVERLLVVRAGEWATRAEDVAALAGAFAEAGLTPELYGGTTANFAELNRRRPPLDVVQGVCYSAQPQEHAFDNASLVECCAALADTVRSARAFIGDRPLSVGPITLRKRVNPYATGPGWQPPSPDPRHRSLFGAGWTLAALKYLAESGVEAVSFAEPPGLDGWPVWLMPLYDLTGWAGAEVLSTVSSEPLAFNGLMVRSGSQTRVLLVNHTAESITLTVTDLPPAVWVYEFDERYWETGYIAHEYLLDDEDYLPRPTNDGRLTLTLNPYAYVRIDGQ